MMRRRGTSWALAALVTLVAACGSGGDNSQPDAAREQPGGTSIASGPVASDVEPVFVPTADGGQLDFNSLRGQDVMLWFWAPW